MRQPPEPTGHGLPLGPSISGENFLQRGPRPHQPVSICHFPSPPRSIELRRRGAEVARSVPHSVTPWSRVLHICSICQWLSAIGAVTVLIARHSPRRAAPPNISQHFSQAPAARCCPP